MLTFEIITPPKGVPAAWLGEDGCVGAEIRPESARGPVSSARSRQGAEHSGGRADGGLRSAWQDHKTGKGRRLQKVIMVFMNRSPCLKKFSKDFSCIMGIRDWLQEPNRE